MTKTKNNKKHQTLFYNFLKNIKFSNKPKTLHT